MGRGVDHRSVTPVIDAFRKFLRGVSIFFYF